MKITAKHLKTAKPKGELHTCEICGVQGQWLPRWLALKRGVKMIVRDHDHKTGYIRGWLCDRCNWWLGLLEACPHIFWERGGDHHWRWWVKEYATQIYEHLQKNTGVLYTP